MTTTRLAPDAWSVQRKRRVNLSVIATGRGPFVVLALMLALVAATLVGAALLGGGSAGADGAPATAAPTAMPGAPAGKPLPVAAPPGWSRAAAWSLPVTAPAPRVPTVAADGSTAAAITADRQLALLDPATGQVRRMVPLPAGDLGGLRLGRVDGRAAALVQVGSQLVYAPVDGTADVTVLVLPDGASVSVAGDSPLVSAPSGASVISGGKLLPLQLPPGAGAMAVDGQTVLAAASSGTWWRIPLGQAPIEMAPSPPRPGAAVARVAGAGHGRVAVVWTGPSDGVGTVALYDASTGEALWTVDAPAEALKSPAWVWAADGKVAAIGPIVFNLGARTATLREGLVPVIAFGGRVYGTVNGASAVIDPSDPAASTTALPAGTPLPWGAPTGRLLMTVASDASGAVDLFALTPDTGAGAAT
ncbi:hypothetical protein LO772_16365 [Yinghuangia sp. ASG 101]|uniref:hypothetical protein n=1 Tax=Yinghuangia sp. ASG 101 TaxID=2896848 RepID=UPI001E5488BF|nr:hypothetical protein [Yinghuangia sp. ASG 101]UGQ15000.1 hypothetical protein LO772_16365 [Yinghuangia sp. ASG 101]